MSNTFTAQDYKETLVDWIQAVRNLNKDLAIAVEGNITKDALIGNAECQLKKLDSMLNKTIDAHEVTKSRLALYENEVGIPHNKGIADHRLNG